MTCRQIRVPLTILKFILLLKEIKGNSINEVGMLILILEF